MTYVVSDLHGNYDKFKELIDKIRAKINQLPPKALQRKHRPRDQSHRN